MPEGLSFNPATRVIYSAPAATQPRTEYTLNAIDYDSPGTAWDDDTAALPFTIAVGPNLRPGFAPQSAVAPQVYAVGDQVRPQLPAAAGGNGPLTYRLSPRLPDGLHFDATTRAIAGIPTTSSPEPRPYTLTATDADGRFTTLTFTIQVLRLDTTPTFGSAAVPHQTYTAGDRVRLQLPVATGGEGILTYTLTPDLPAGLTFNPQSLTIAGQPTGVSDTRRYTLTATDPDGAFTTLTFTIQVLPSDDDEPGRDPSPSDDPTPVPPAAATPQPTPALITTPAPAATPTLAPAVPTATPAAPAPAPTATPASPAATPTRLLPAAPTVVPATPSVQPTAIVYAMPTATASAPTATAPAATVAPAATAAPPPATPEPAPAATPVPPSGTGEGSGLLVPALIGAAVLVAIAIAVAIIIVRRRAR